jgi:hypothetical protein
MTSHELWRKPSGQCGIWLKRNCRNQMSQIQRFSIGGPGDTFHIVIGLLGLVTYVPAPFR